MKTHRAFSQVALLVIVLATPVGLLACGDSTVEQLASAVPPTSAPPGATPVAAISAATQQPKPSNTARASAAPATPTPSPEPLEIVSQGFGQDERQLGFAFVVENSNRGYAFENSQYQVAAYDAAGTVVDTESGYMQLILPGQRLGVGGTMFLNEGVTVAKLDTRMNPGRMVATELVATFTADKVVYRPSDISPRVVGEVVNPYDRDMTSLRVSAVVYGGSGDIVGGGFTFLNFVLARGTVGAEVLVTCAGDVSKVELYSTLSGLSTLTSGDKLPEGVQSLELVKSGFGRDENQVGYGMLVRNPNPRFAVENSMYHVTLYDKDGYVIAAEEGYVDTLLPGQTLGVGGDSYVDKGMIAQRGDFQVKSGTFEASEAIPGFTCENVSYVPDRYSPKVTGEIVSPYTKDVTNLRVSAIAYDVAGDIIGGGFTFLDFVLANSRAAAQVSITSAGTPAEVELYAAVSGLSDFD